MKGFINWLFPDAMAEYRKQRIITESICADAGRRAEKAKQDLAKLAAKGVKFMEGGK